jgi:hypothetical protein
LLVLALRRDRRPAWWLGQRAYGVTAGALAAAVAVETTEVPTRAWP